MEVNKTNKSIGNHGEQKAVEYLRAQNFTILEQNYRYKRAEIDIICFKDNTLIFVEVKTRKNDLYGNPEEFVTNRKRDLFLETADHYIDTINWQGDLRFDVIAITNTTKEILHIEDAFH